MYCTLKQNGYGNSIHVIIYQPPQQDVVVKIDVMRNKMCENWPRESVPHNENTLLAFIWSFNTSLHAVLNKIMFLYFYLRQGGYVFTCVCMFVCLSVNRITQKLLIKTLWNCMERFDIIQGPIDHILNDLDLMSRSPLTRGKNQNHFMNKFVRNCHREFHKIKM